MAQERRAAARSPMAAIAVQVMRLAKEKASRASLLAEQMEPYVGRKYGESSVSAWATGSNVPPGDALLAAARAANISIDQFLGDGLEVGLTDQADLPEPIAWKDLIELPARVAQIESSLAEIEGQRGNLADIAAALDHIREEVAQSGVMLAKCVHALDKAGLLEEAGLGTSRRPAPKVTRRAVD